MACTTDFIDSVCSQLRQAGEVRSRKMFGDYVIFLKRKNELINAASLEMGRRSTLYYLLLN